VHLRALRTVKGLEEQVAHLEQKRQLVKELGDDLTRASEHLVEREEQIERAELAVGKLKVRPRLTGCYDPYFRYILVNDRFYACWQSEQETVRTDVSKIEADGARVRDELRQHQQTIVQIVAETERLARDSVGILQAKRQLDADQVSPAFTPRLCSLSAAIWRQCAGISDGRVLSVGTESGVRAGAATPHAENTAARRRAIHPQGVSGNLGQAECRPQRNRARDARVSRAVTF
jgi:hypothetical protein